MAPDDVHQGDLALAATLPPLDDVLASVGGWASALTNGDVARQRDLLALLIDRVVPVRTGYGKYTAEITWTPLGEGLRRLAAVTV